MIYEREILKGNKVPEEYEHNLLELLIKINNVRDAFGRPMTVTSGFRTKEDHRRIYRSQGVPDHKIPWGSAHLSCQAVDIADPDNVLMDWCKKNVELLRTIGLWLEEDNGKWVHFQTKPFASYKLGGTIFFKA